MEDTNLIINFPSAFQVEGRVITLEDMVSISIQGIGLNSFDFPIYCANENKTLAEISSDTKIICPYDTKSVDFSDFKSFKLDDPMVVDSFSVAWAELTSDEKEVRVHEAKLNGGKILKFAEILVLEVYVLI